MGCMRPRVCAEGVPHPPLSHCPHCVSICAHVHVGLVTRVCSWDIRGLPRQGALSLHSYHLRLPS